MALLTSIPTGLTILDDARGGLPRGVLTAIGGRPGTGLFTMSAAIALGAAYAGASIDWYAPDIPEADVERRRDRYQSWSNAPTGEPSGRLVVRQGGVRIADIAGQIDEATDVVVVDYVTLIEPGVDSIDLHQALRDLATLARIHDISVVVSMYLVRAADHERPTAEHLRSRVVADPEHLAVLLHPLIPPSERDAYRSGTIPISVIVDAGGDQPQESVHHFVDDGWPLY